MNIRPAILADVKVIHAMLRASAAEQNSEHLLVDEASLQEDGFGAAPRFEVTIAEVNGKPAGLALYFPVYSTWNRKGIYLEDLYVAPEFRRRGVARKLMQHLAGLAVKNGAQRIAWHVFRTNPAVKFYERIGAEVNEAALLMRLSGPQIEKLADEIHA